MLELRSLRDQADDQEQTSGVAASRLADRQVELERLAGVGLMTAGVVHDVGNLMQIVDSGARLAMRKLESGSQSEALEVLAGVRQAAGRACSLGRTLLDRASTKRRESEPIDLASALAGMAQVLRWAAGPSVRLEILALGSPLKIVGDRGALEDALVNLVANARDAMPDGGKVCISAQRVEIERRPLVEIRVSDTGSGLAPEVARQAFEPFYTTKADGKGSGLGLASVAAFLRELGGETALECQPGKGAVIIMRIPEHET